MRVVIIGAETAAGNLLNFVLHTGGHETVRVSGVDGLSEVSTQSTDMVFARDDLPHGDACWCCAELRARGFSGPIIFVSRLSTMSAKVCAFDHGADDYIVEPYNPSELFARVNAVVRRCHQRDPLIVGDLFMVDDAGVSPA